MSVEWYGQQVASQTRKSAELGLFNAANHILRESNKIVPHETGALEISGMAQVEGTKSTVAYTEVYAARQHEELGWKHDPGRQAKYLETSVDSNAQVAQKLIAAAIRRGLGG